MRPVGTSHNLADKLFGEQEGGRAAESESESVSMPIEGWSGRMATDCTDEPKELGDDPSDMASPDSKLQHQKAQVAGRPPRCKSMRRSRRQSAVRARTDDQQCMSKTKISAPHRTMSTHLKHSRHHQNHLTTPRHNEPSPQASNSKGRAEQL